MKKNIAITETYLSSVFKLDNQSKKLTLNTITQMSENPKSTSLQIHSIDRIKCDSKFRSARVNDDLRVIFAIQGDTFTLLYVDHHDAAYNWCEGKYLNRTSFGAEYIYDEKVMLSSDFVPEEKDFFGNYESPLLEKANIKVKHLAKLDIPQIHAENLLTISNEDRFIEYITIFPAEIQEGLIDIVTGSKSFDTVYNELMDDENSGEESNPLEHKDSKRRFYITQSIEELEMLMENDDFEKWTIFLHPSQEKLVKKNFNGPALIEGGPGTGKTIVGIHRAVFLSQNVYKAEDNKKILFCTFSKKLAKVISGKLEKLMKQHNVKNNIDVVSIDSFIFSALKKNLGSAKPISDANAITELIDRLYDKLNPKGSKGFYEYEYFEIIEKYNIKTLNEYLEADRSGTGMPLDKNARTTAWAFISEVLKAKEENEVYTFVDRAYDLLKGLADGTIAKEYDSIIIDEAQDLETIKLRAICNCVRTDKNNILILSDVNQRIFRLSTWKKDGGINVVGRTHHLSVNYRTTKQINDYARYQFVNSEMITSHIKEYKSIFNGVEPLIESFPSESAQYKYIVTKVNELSGNNYPAEQICVICSTVDECKQVHSILTFSDVKSTILTGDAIPSADTGICICPINGVKGLEFEAVILFNYNNIGKSMLNDSQTAAVKINYEKLIECEKYVAATRARNELIITYLEDANK